jgi:ribosomal protein S18 acetylase RimI-like enzyme
MSAFEIVPYRSSDFPTLIQFVEAIQEHERATVRELKPGPEIGRLYAETLLREVSSQEGCIFMARADGCNIGFACAWKDVDDDPLLREEMRAHALISDIFVADGWRRRGVAAELLAAVEAAMFERGSMRIRVCAKAANTLAIDCYDRAGYRPYEIIFSKPLVK